MERRYEIVLTFVMPNQQEVYALWDVELYCNVRTKSDFKEFIMNGNKNGFGVDPIEVHASIYLNPVLHMVDTPLGQESLLIGKKILLLDSF